VVKSAGQFFMPDPRWLEILKASGWQLLALAIAFGLFLLADVASWIPALPAWGRQAAVLAFLICTALWLASLVAAVVKFAPPGVWLIHWRKVRRQRRETRNYIPHMTEKEREIIAYLLAKNQKMFTADAEGGHAITLISRGIVVRALVAGQVFSIEDVPFAIPDHIWNELVAQRERFPYDPRGEAERPYPWRVHWMAR
jgi:hypothetical protein